MTYTLQKNTKNAKRIDYLIVGSGLFGSICAYELNKRGFKVIVLEKRSHVGGNIFTENIEGINVHKYGAHIFHTSNIDIWNYINRFAKFNNFINSPIARYKNELYNLPFNMNTFSKLWNDVFTPEDAKKRIKEEIETYHINEPQNLEEQAINLVGPTIYEKLIKGYTAKQWGRQCTELPPFIIKRLPVRFIYDNNYFNDRYQGIPVGGYTQIIEKMLNGIEVRLNYDYFSHKDEIRANAIIYTGPIDQFFNNKYGPLEYRSVRFENEIIDIPNYQGNAVVNYTECNVPYTRIIEHKHFEFDVSSPKTVISKEYPSSWRIGDEPYYPVNDKKNNELYLKYKNDADKLENIYFGGRLAQYKYLDMDDTIEEAFKLLERLGKNV